MSASGGESGPELAIIVIQPETEDYTSSTGTYDPSETIA